VKTELKYGLIIALASAALLIIQDLAGLYNEHIQYLSSISWVGYIIPVIGLFFAIKEKRDKDPEGFISYGRCIGTGVLTSLVSGIIGAVVQYVFISFVNPGFTERLMDIQREQMLDNGLPPEQADAAMGMVQFMFSPLMMTLLAFTGAVIAGVVISLIIGAILKKVPKQEFE